MGLNFVCLGICWFFWCRPCDSCLCFVWPQDWSYSGWPHLCDASLFFLYHVSFQTQWKMMTSQQIWSCLLGCLSLYSPSWKNIWDSSPSSGGMEAGCSLWINPNPCWSDKAKPKFFDLFGKSFLFIHEFYCGQDMGKILALRVCTGKCFSFCSFKWRKGFCSPPCIASLRGNCLYCHCCFYIAMGTDLKCCIH